MGARGLAVLGFAAAGLLGPGVDWCRDYESARSRAKELDRLVLLHFYSAGRPLSRSMEEETFQAAPVAQLAREKFVCVRVDSDAHPELFEATIGGRGALATCLVDAEGDVISALHGFAGPEQFRRFLEHGSAGYAAVRAAREALREKPSDPVRVHALAEAYRSADSLRRAEECYRSVIDLAARAPGQDAEAVHAAAASHERLARLRIMRGKNLEARTHLEAARRLDPEGRWARTDRLLLTEGLTLAVERRHAESAGVLEDALRRFPASEEADHMLYALGFALHLDGRNEPALEALQSALRRFPESSWTGPIREQIDHIRNPQPDHTH